MTDLSNNVLQLRKLEEANRLLYKEVEELERSIAAKKSQIERNNRIADSYRAVITYESSQSIDFAATKLTNPVDESKDVQKKDDSGNKLAPSDLLKPEYKGVVQNEIINRILIADPLRRFKTDEIVDRAYNINNADERKLVKRTMAAALSRGISKGLWKGGSGVYYLEEKARNDNAVA